MNKLMIITMLVLNLTACTPIENLGVVATQAKINSEQVKEGKKTIEKVEKSISESLNKENENLKKAEEN